MLSVYEAIYEYPHLDGIHGEQTIIPKSTSRYIYMAGIEILPGGYEII